MIDDSFYFGVEEDEEGANSPESFPVTYPFSATVPELGLALLKVRFRRPFAARPTCRSYVLSLLTYPPPPICEYLVCLAVRWWRFSWDGPVVFLRRSFFVVSLADRCSCRAPSRL